VFFNPLISPPDLRGEAAESISPKRSLGIQARASVAIRSPMTVRQAVF
jgi:hypothetical protein